MNIKFEVVVSITAMITAVAAVAVAIIQTKVMQDEAEMEREHARLSVLPSLQVYTHSHTSTDDGKFRLGIVNQGIGPAVLEGFQIKLEGTPVASWSQMVAQGTNGAAQITGPDRNIGTVMTSDIEPGLLIPAGERLVPIQLETSTEVGAILRQMGDKLDVEICYCSLFKECWATSLEEVRPLPINSCQPYEKSFFRNEIVSSAED